MFKYLIASCLVLILSSSYAHAQKFEYEGSLQGIGDNREYTPEYNRSQTIFGVRANALVGTTIEDQHKLRVGISYLYEFGTETDYNKPQLTAYYRFDDSKTQFYFGAFPRLETIDFPLAMLSDTIQYYHPNIEGILASHTWGWGHQLAFVDWTSKQLSDQRECFTAATSGMMNWKSFYFKNYIILNHHALTAGYHPEEHITDNLGYLVNLGYDFTSITRLKNFSLEAGVLGSALRDRGTDDGYLWGQSFWCQLVAEWNKVGIKNTLTMGDEQTFLTGDSYYKQDNYMRTDFIWNFISHKNIQANFTLSIHTINWDTIDNQQQISLIYKI